MDVFSLVFLVCSRRGENVILLLFVIIAVVVASIGFVFCAQDTGKSFLDGRFEPNGTRDGSLRLFIIIRKRVRILPPNAKAHTVIEATDILRSNLFSSWRRQAIFLALGAFIV